jgi:copper homeostasis protein
MKKSSSLEKVILTDMKFELEVIAFDILSCQIAADNGANRIELCANPHEGGTTPSYGMMKAARKVSSIQLFPIIRPRGGDFLYSDEEFESMKDDIKAAQDIGCEGVVIGILNKDGGIDIEKCQELVELSKGLDVTFHRAFDRVSDPYSSLEQIIAMGCKRILSSGLKPTAMEGSLMIKTLVAQANGRIKIMPGSGIRSDNIVQLAKDTGAICFHSSARKTLESKMFYLNAGMKENLVQVSLDGKEVKQIKNNLVAHFHSTN